MFSPIQRFADELALYEAMLTERTFAELTRTDRRYDDEGGGSAVREPRVPRPGGSPALVVCGA